MTFFLTTVLLGMGMILFYLSNRDGHIVQRINSLSTVLNDLKATIADLKIDIESQDNVIDNIVVVIGALIARLDDLPPPNDTDVSIIAAKEQLILLKNALELQTSKLIDVAGTVPA